MPEGLDIPNSQYTPLSQETGSEHNLTGKERRMIRRELRPFTQMLEMNAAYYNFEKGQKDAQVNPDVPGAQEQFQNSRDIFYNSFGNFIDGLIGYDAKKPEKNSPELTQQRNGLRQQLRLDVLQNLPADETWVADTEGVEGILRQKMEVLAENGIDLRFLVDMLGEYSPKTALEAAQAGKVSLTNDQLQVLKKLYSPNWLQRRIKALGPVQKIGVEALALALSQGLEDVRAKLVNVHSINIPAYGVNTTNTSIDAPGLAEGPLSHMGDLTDAMWASVVGEKIASVLFPNLKQSIRSAMGAAVGFVTISLYELGITHHQKPDVGDIIGGSPSAIVYALLPHILRKFYAIKLQMGMKKQKASSEMEQPLLK